MRLKSNIPAQRINSFEIRNAGRQTKLFNGDQLIMTDRDLEWDEHAVFFNLALRGNVLVTGLGVGLVNEHLINVPEIKRVVIVEKHKEVIDMVWPHCTRDDRFEIVHDDADTWPISTMHFDFAWLDHWTELHEMKQEAWWDFILEKYSKNCDFVMTWKPSFLAQKQ